jgi:hypothetical protein
VNHPFILGLSKDVLRQRRLSVRRGGQSKREREGATTHA